MQLAVNLLRRAELQLTLASSAASPSLYLADQSKLVVQHFSVQPTKHPTILYIFDLTVHRLTITKVWSAGVRKLSRFLQLSFCNSPVPRASCLPASVQVLTVSMTVGVTKSPAILRKRIPSAFAIDCARANIAAFLSIPAKLSTSVTGF